MTVRALRSLPPLETAVLAVALVVLVGVGVARQRAEHPPAALDSYSSYDAASGGYRAFEELLVREAVRTERFERRPAFLDAALDTLIYVEPLAFDPRQDPPTRADVAALEAWVRGGGRLLYVGYDDAAAKAGILALPGTRSGATRRGMPPPQAFVAPSLAALGIADARATAPRRWDVPHRRTHVLLADAHGALVVVTPLGAGSVVAVVDRTLFANAGIATADRARLAVALARPRHSGGTIAFDEAVHGYVTPEHWWTIVPRRFAVALAIAAVALGIALAGAALRFGPPLVPPRNDGRTTFEFIDALASLFARDGNVRETLHDAAHSARRALTRAFALPAAASNQEIAARIEREELREAFHEMNALAETGSRERDLVRGVTAAQRLRKDYAGHGHYGN